MLRKWLCQLDATLQLNPIDPILIKSGYATLDGPDMVPVSTMRDGKKTYFFPGSSLKGVLRSHFERIAPHPAPGSVCLPYYDSRKERDFNVPVAEERTSYGCGFRGPADGRSDTSATAYHEACAACRLFGSLRFAGRFSVGDAYPTAGHEPRATTRNGVGIDRFTGGTVPGVLFDLVVIEGGVFETKLRVTNFELWQLAAVNFLLMDLKDEQIAIGSGRSRGLGRVRGDVTHYTLSYAGEQTSVAGIAELATADEKETYKLFDWRELVSVALQAGKCRGVRYEYNLDKDWEQTLGPLAVSLHPFLMSHKPMGEPMRK